MQKNCLLKTGFVWQLLILNLTKFAFELFARISIDRGIAEFKGHGQFGELLHDIFDEIIISKKIEKGESVENPDDFLNSPMTSWHNDETPC